MTDDYVLMQAMVAAGQGAVILPGLARTAHRRDDVATLALDPPLHREVAVWLPAKRTVVPSARQLLSELTRLAPAVLT